MNLWNVGWHPNVWKPKELRTNIDRNHDGVTIMRNERQSTNLWQNIGSNYNDSTPNEQKFNIVRTQDNVPVTKNKRNEEIRFR